MSPETGLLLRRQTAGCGFVLIDRPVFPVSLPVPPRIYSSNIRSGVSERGNDMKRFPIAASLLSIAVATATQANSKLEEVVVTASHLPIPESQSANAITVIDSELIDNRAPLAVSDLLRDVSGLAVSRNGVLGSTTQVRVRGAEANHLLVLIDGVEANDPSQSDELNWGTLTAHEIERIEVIRGPQSALHGSDALAGVVNIITRSANEPFAASVFTEAGSFNTRHSGMSLGSKGEQYGVRLGVSHLESDGDNISRLGSEEDGYRNTSFNLKSSWTPVESLRLSLVARQNDGLNEFDAVSFATGLPADANLFTEFRNSTARLQGEYSALEGAWQHRLSFSQSKNDNENFDTGVITGSSESDKQQVQYLTSFNWDDKGQRVSLLLETEEEDYKQRGPITFADPNQDRSRDTDSVAVEYRGTFMDNLTLATSARFDSNSEFDDAETYRLEASYQLTDTRRVRVAWGTAVKNPTFSERFGFFPSFFIGNADLQPEESESWELGMDEVLLDGKLQLSMTWFNSTLEREINGFAFDPVTFLFTGENINGESNRQGAEVEVNAQVSDSLSVNASYTYTDSTQEDSATGADVDEIRRARHIASLNLGWQPLEKLQLNFNAQYNGKQDDTFFPPFPQPQQTVEMDDFTLVNINANYSVTEQLRVYVRLDNVLDEEYEEVFGFQTLGFGAHVGVRYNFVQ